MSAVESTYHEKRITFLLYDSWDELAGETTLPSLKNMSKDKIATFKKNLVLLDLRNDENDPDMMIVGQNLALDLDEDLTGKRHSQIPRKTMLSRVTDHYKEVLANRVPIAFEAEFVNKSGENTLYRGILLPFSDDNEQINFILGGVRWILEKDVKLDDTEPSIEELMASASEGEHQTIMASNDIYPEADEEDDATTADADEFIQEDETASDSHSEINEVESQNETDTYPEDEILEKPEELETEIAETPEEEFAEELDVMDIEENEVVLTEEEISNTEEQLDDQNTDETVLEIDEEDLSVVENVATESVEENPESIDIVDTMDMKPTFAEEMSRVLAEDYQPDDINIGSLETDLISQSETSIGLTESLETEISDTSNLEPSIDNLVEPETELEHSQDSPEQDNIEKEPEVTFSGSTTVSVKTFEPQSVENEILEDIEAFDSLIPSDQGDEDDILELTEEDIFIELDNETEESTAYEDEIIDELTSEETTTAEEEISVETELEFVSEEPDAASINANDENEPSIIENDLPTVSEEIEDNLEVTDVDIQITESISSDEAYIVPDNVSDVQEPSIAEMMEDIIESNPELQSTETDDNIQTEPETEKAERKSLIERAAEQAGILNDITNKQPVSDIQEDQPIETSIDDNPYHEAASLEENAKQQATNVEFQGLTIQEDNVSATASYAEENAPKQRKSLIEMAAEKSLQNEMQNLTGHASAIQEDNNEVSADIRQVEVITYTPETEQVSDVIDAEEPLDLQNEELVAEEAVEEEIIPDEGSTVGDEFDPDAIIDNVSTPEPTVTAKELKATLKQIIGYIKKEDANHNRSRDSLYNILAAIYGFYFTCEKAPDAYAEIVKENKLKIQSRAPFTPVLKICLGSDYDKTRLTEYAATLALAKHLEIEPDDFPDFVKEFPGGIKGCVKALRELRKTGSSPAIKKETISIEDAKEIVGNMPILGSFRLKKIIIGQNQDDFCLLLAKRDGHNINVLKILDESYSKIDPIIKRAAFIKGNQKDGK